MSSRLGRVVAVVEPGVGVELVVLQVVVAAAGELVGARARDEADLNRALAGARRVLGRRVDGDFFDGVETRADAREESVSRLQVIVLRAHAVNRDVDRALREPVDRGIARAARAARRADARQQRHELERAPAAGRDLQDLVAVDRRGHGC